MPLSSAVLSPARRIALIAAAFASLALPAAAEDSERVSPEVARTHIQTLGDEAIRILRQEDVPLEDRRRQFREMLRQDFHLRMIGLLALGHHRRAASAAQIEEFMGLFSEFVLMRYSRLLGGYTDETFVVTGARESGKRDVAVQSRIVPRSGEPLSVEWVMRRFNDSVRIIDVRIENVSMVIAQRDEFNTVIQRGGFDALLRSLRTQLDMLAADNPA
jgi:phospholipid transport system substrate-binding protein